MASSSDSVSQWIVQLKDGQEEAARQIVERYFQEVARLAQRNMNGQISPAFDGEDVALSVLHALCAGARKGQFPTMTDRNDLWGLLIAVTKRKVVDRLRHHRRQKRGGEANHVVFSALADGANVSWNLSELLVDSATPEFIATLKDECRNLIARLRTESLRSIAQGVLAGESVGQIAEHLGIAPRSVERKISLIQSKWTEILFQDD